MHLARDVSADVPRQVERLRQSVSNFAPTSTTQLSIKKKLLSSAADPTRFAAAYDRFVAAGYSCRCSGIAHALAHDACVCARQSSRG